MNCLGHLQLTCSTRQIHKERNDLVIVLSFQTGRKKSLIKGALCWLWNASETPARLPGTAAGWMSSGYLLAPRVAWEDTGGQPDVFQEGKEAFGLGVGSSQPILDKEIAAIRYAPGWGWNGVGWEAFSVVRQGESANPAILQPVTCTCTATEKHGKEFCLLLM